MPLVVVNITQNNQVVEFAQDIHPQHMRLRTVHIEYGAPSSTNPQNGILVDLDDILATGREITGFTVNQKSHQNIYFPRPATAPYHFAIDTNLGLDMGIIPRSFAVRVYDDNAQKSATTFNAANVHQITMYFEHSTHDRTHG
jgi:hypothetical protein